MSNSRKNGHREKSGRLKLRSERNVDQSEAPRRRRKLNTTKRVYQTKKKQYVSSNRVDKERAIYVNLPKWVVQEVMALAKERQEAPKSEVPENEEMRNWGRQEHFVRGKDGEVVTRMQESVPDSPEDLNRISTEDCPDDIGQVEEDFQSVPGS